MVPPLTAIQRSNSEEFIQVSDDLLTCLLISTAMDQPMTTVDILHPFASLEWQEYQQLPVRMSDATAVWHRDKLYIGGGYTPTREIDDARLYIYTPTTSSWNILDTPVCWFTLAIYSSKLVLVGGYVDASFSNKLLTLTEYNQQYWWQETLPPMATERSHSCVMNHKGHILVAGGETLDGFTNVVEVYNGSHWSFAQSLPKEYFSLKSAILDGHWYLIGGYGDWGVAVHYASLDSLLVSCELSKISQISSVWERLTDAPYHFSSATVFGSRLIAIGGEEALSSTSNIHAYCFNTNSWIHVGDMPFPVSDACSVILPTKELVVVGGHGENHILKANVKATPYDPNNYFTMRALSHMEKVGISVMKCLNGCTQLLEQLLGPLLGTSNNATSLLHQWSTNTQLDQCLPPTWKNLLQIIHLLGLDNLGQKIEKYLKREPKEQYSEVKSTTNVAEDDIKIRLRDEAIFILKQENALLKGVLAFENSRLKAENEQLRALTLQVKYEDNIRLDDKPSSLRTELKEEEKEEEEVEKALATVTKSQPQAQYYTATWNMHSIEVCGEMTVVVYSSHDQQISWPGYGLRLHIPKGCLPAGMEQCTINIKASLAGQYEFPENSHLVSAVYWLRCEEVHKFTRPITLEIQHCTKSENVTGLKLSFVRAVCSQKQLPYTFKQLSGGIFTSHSSYGVIELNNFSGVGVTQEGSEDREYCSRIFYMHSSQEEPINREIHFVVTWNIEAHLMVTENKYNEKGALAGPHQPVEFESDMISLDIPMEGISIKGWKIIPLIRPVVTKKQVDNFREGKLTPCCQLLASVTGRKKKISTLQHQVKLNGAKYPNNIFVINLPAEGSSPQERDQTFGDLDTIGPPPFKKRQIESDDSFPTDPSRSQSLPEFVLADSASLAGPSSAVIQHSRQLDAGLEAKLDLDSDQYFKVTQYLQKLNKQHIRNVGGALGLSYSNMEKMTSYPDDMVAAWLRREDFVMSMSGEPTWRTLVEALRKVGQEGTARDIEEAENR